MTATTTITEPTTTTTAAASPTLDQPKITTKTMDQDLFQFFDSLSQPSPVGEWFTSTSQDISPVVAPASTHSSPEIATPMDVHLSPSAPKIEPATAAAFATTVGAGVAADLDMSEILNSPIFDSPAPAMTPAMTPATPHIDMFSDLSHDLPSALAAFVAAVSSVPNASVTGSSSYHNSSASLPTGGTSSPVVQSLNSMAMSPATTTIDTRKRSSTESDDTNVDEAAIKRQKNTDAARRSRLKKVMKMESLEKRVNELERMNAQLLLRVAVLDSEKSHLQTKEATHEARIKTLEAQLAEAHKALASRSL